MTEQQHPGQHPGQPAGQHPQAPPPPPSGYPPPGWGQPGQPPAWLPAHPDTQRALVLGLVALSGFVACGLTFLVGPWAWREGARVRRAIDAEPYRWGGRGDATTAMVCGMVATAALVLVVLVLVALFGLFAVGSFSVIDL